jgi:hypothetical protein
METTTQQQLQSRVASKLFYTYEEQGSIKFLQQMGSTCLQTLKLETYLVGKLTKFIWQEDIDVEYFLDSLTIARCRVHLKEMLDLDPNM